MMTSDKMIEVIRAAQDGKQIQRRVQGTTFWSTCDPTHWNFGALDYRVKPEEATKPRMVKLYQYLCRAEDKTLFVHQRPMPMITTGYIGGYEVVQRLEPHICEVDAASIIV
jgi:hypothetical protein